MDIIETLATSTSPLHLPFQNFWKLLEREGVHGFGRKPSSVWTIMEMIKRKFWKPGDLIIELGTSRGKYGGGASGDGQLTYLWGLYSYYFNITTITVDISKDSLSECRRLTKKQEDRITYIESNALDFLRNTTVVGTPCLIYLDSMDSSPNPQDPIVRKACIHQLEEAILVEKRFPDNNGLLVLIDDVKPDGSGKAELSIKFLEYCGYKKLFSCLETGQVLMSKMEIL